MAYTGSTRCTNCKKEFNYFCLPYRNNDDDTEEPLSKNPILSDVFRSQMVLEYVDENNIPTYTAHCPYCERIVELPKGDAVKIPAFYFEKYSEQTD